MAVKEDTRENSTSFGCKFEALFLSLLDSVYFGFLYLILIAFFETLFFYLRLVSKLA